MSWQTKPLGDVVTLQRGYDLPKQDRQPGSVPIVSSSGFSGTHSEARVAAPGVVTGRYGSIGQVHFVETDFWPLNTTLFVKDFKGNDPRFVAYLLRTIDYASCSDKSSVPGVNRNDLHRIQVAVPDLPEQRWIAETLGSLDDKIELNRRMNHTLESIARATFRSWFVDFDPVRKKMEGGEAGLPPDLAAALPAEFHEHGERLVPRDWALDPLRTQVSVARGLSYAGAGLSEAGMPMHNLNSFLEGGGHKPEGMKFYTGAFEERHVVQPGDVLVANTEQGHERRLIAFACLVTELHGERGIFTHHLFRVRPLPGSSLTPQYLTYWFNSRVVQAEISAYATGTTVNTLPSDALERPLVLVPPPDLVRAFSRFADVVAGLVGILDRQSRTLTRARDALLPELLSGRLPVGVRGHVLSR